MAGAKAHGIYSHSSEPGHSLRENIVFNGFGFGIHCYSEIGEPLAGYTIEGNAVFNNGILNTNPVNSIWPNYLIGGTGNFSNTPVRNLKFLNNFGYYSKGCGCNLALGYLDTTNINCIVRSNYFGRGYVHVGRWNEITFSDNTLAGLSTTFRFNPGPVTPVGQWNRNTYFSSFSTPFLRDETDFLTFANWKSKTGFDLESEILTQSPSGARVFVRTNAYEAGRANVIVFNWDLNSSIEVDLRTVLPSGKSYEVRNAQDYFGQPVVKGTYDGKPVRLPLAGLSVARPTGLVSEPSFTGPEFAVFCCLAANHNVASATCRPTRGPLTRPEVKCGATGVSSQPDASEGGTGSGWPVSGIIRD